ncbi:MAG: hypothetical protein GXY55_15375 [Phycisphaerae bacterium]|nr:hypothetical protein [Phycisphaerae bacterium]
MSFCGRVILAIGLAGLGMGAGCGWQDLPADEEAGPVFVLAVEGLEPPAVGYQKAYRPERIRPIDAADPAAGQAICFFLTVATTSPQQLRFELDHTQAESEAIASHAVHRFASLQPSAAQAAVTLDAEDWIIDPDVRQRLADGQGVYWLRPTTGDGPSCEWQVAVAIPTDILGSFALLNAFTATTPDGFPLGGDRIELVQDFFYMATLGDSVASGNGLPFADKYASQTAQLIERRLGRKVIHQFLAVSGATVVPHANDTPCTGRCYAEAPTVSSSLPLQAELIQRPDLVDLVLLTGCLNDVSATTLLDQTTSIETIAELTEHFCRDEMVDLLTALRVRLPRARIVVAGYFPIISPASGLPALGNWLESIDGQSAGDLEGFFEHAADTSRVFVDTAHPGMVSAVTLVNTAAGQQVAAFADPGFGPDNALFAPDSWLWGLTTEVPQLDGVDTDMEVFPEDPNLAERLPVCTSDHEGIYALKCLYISVGHPNLLGSQAYVEAITGALNELGILATSGD